MCAYLLVEGAFLWHVKYHALSVAFNPSSWQVVKRVSVQQETMKKKRNGEEKEGGVYCLFW